MSTFANWPISRKLAAAFAAVILVVFAASAVIYDRLTVIEGVKNRRVHTTDVLQTLQLAMDGILDQETGVRGYLITGDERFLEPYHRGGRAYTPAIQRVKTLIADNSTQQSRLNELDELVKKWHSDFAERAIALTAKPETREATRALEGSMVGKTIMDLIRAKVDEIEDVERELLAKSDAVQKRAYATAYMMIVLGGAASLMIAVLMGVLLMRGITVPIARMTSAMSALVKGDTSIEVPEVNRSDEIGAMAAAVQVFKESIVERERAQAELAHVNRVATMGQLTAAIAHEVNQPITAALTNAEAALRFLSAHPPDLDEVRQALSQIAADSKRAGDVISRIRAVIKKAPPSRARFDLNEAVLDVIALTRSEVLRHRVLLRTQLAGGLPLIEGERVQLQQVILNLILNAVDAMGGLADGARELKVSTEDSADGVLVTVQDSGPGLGLTDLDRVFEAFYTTKPEGMGMGLAICRSIIAAHGGRMWAGANTPRGAVFQFTLVPERSETAPAEKAGPTSVG